MNREFSMIDDLVREGAIAAGLSEAKARFALTGALGLLERHAARDRLSALYAAVPGAEALATSPQARAKPRGGGLFGGVMRSAGGLSGAAIADAMAMLDVAAKAGISRQALKLLLRSAESGVKSRGGGEVLQDAIASVPGVGGLLTPKT
jgi:hypothetical protein